MNTETLLRYTSPEDEQPLDHLVTDGGYAGIFRTIACVGDSLSSGEMEVVGKDGAHQYYDFFPYSWGQFLARMTGSTVRNFSRGGMTAAEYCETFADQMGFFDPAKACQAYLIALGVNDLYNCRGEVGSLSDICPDDPTKNAHTFIGYYARIIQQYKAIQPDAKFFLISHPRQILYEFDEVARSFGYAMTEALRSLSDYFDRTYFIDLHTYAPVHDEAFLARFYMNGHLNALGYRLLAEQIVSYMDYIIRRRPRDFNDVAFIGSDIPFPESLT